MTFHRVIISVSRESLLSNEQKIIAGESFMEIGRRLESINKLVKRAGFFLILYSLFALTFFIINIFFIKNENPYSGNHFSNLALFALLAFPFIIYYIYVFNKSKNEFIKLLYIDPVTGLPNRQKLIIDTQTAKNPVLALINIDSFKEINNVYGNETGDLLLIMLGERLLNNSTFKDSKLYRTQADEFAILMDRKIIPGEIEKLSDALCREVNDNFFLISGHEIYIRISMGIALGKEVYSSKIIRIWQDIAANADMALKRAKKIQKSYIIYDERMEITKEYANSIIWRQKLKEAIRDKRIVPFFQPIVNNITRRVEKHESLARLIDKEGNIVIPHYFLGIAKKSRLYSDITRTMIASSFDVFKNNSRDFSINLTVNDIMDEEMRSHIKRTVKENSNLAKRLTFEIVETEDIHNYDEVKDFIDYIRSFGSKFAIDDFGSGYSNFIHMMKLDVDYIKIDSSLIQHIEKDSHSQNITETIVNFAKKLNIKTIAEYVCSREIFEKTRDLGIDYSQGFYFGEPQPYLLIDDKFA